MNNDIGVVPDVASVGVVGGSWPERPPEPLNPETAPTAPVDPDSTPDAPPDEPITPEPAPVEVADGAVSDDAVPNTDTALADDTVQDADTVVFVTVPDTNTVEGNTVQDTDTVQDGSTAEGDTVPDMNTVPDADTAEESTVPDSNTVPDTDTVPTSDETASRLHLAETIVRLTEAAEALAAAVRPLEPSEDDGEGGGEGTGSGGATDDPVELPEPRVTDVTVGKGGKVFVSWEVDHDRYVYTVKVDGMEPDSVRDGYAMFLNIKPGNRKITACAFDPATDYRSPMVEGRVMVR